MQVVSLLVIYLSNLPFLAASFERFSLVLKVDLRSRLAIDVRTLPQAHFAATYLIFWSRIKDQKFPKIQVFS